MKLDQQTIVDILVKENYITSEDIAAAEQASAEHNTSKIDFLLQKNILTKDILGQAVAEHYQVRFVDVSKHKIDDAVFFTIPEIVARAQQVVGLSRTQEGVLVAMSDPGDMEMRQLLAKRYNETIIPVFALPEAIEAEFKRYAVDLQTQFGNIVQAMSADEVDLDAKNQKITEAVDVILEAGVRNNASDIHMNPQEKHVTVRFRIDGMLHDVLTIEKPLYEYLLSRIKILAKMRTDEHRTAQDGKFRFTDQQGQYIDVRVSVVPTTNQENIVMRLLSAQSRQYSLKDIGLSSRDLDTVQSVAKNPHGMILVTGPTGSGKTTTLYAILHILNQREVNIATIEDPVEYDIGGITQIQVNTKTGLTFATGLRAIVRQDPDIIMVGEIRDEETAGIAINSALTGHLVLSTLHTNDAATALPRFLDMNIEQFLVVSTLSIVVAQRLIRKNCSSCVHSYTPDDKQKKILQSNKQLVAILEKQGIAKLDGVRLYQGQGCKLCGETGYAGRVGVFEVLEMTDEIRDLIMHHANADQIKKKAVEQGMTTMMEDAVAKMLKGLTSLDEVLRVTME